MHRDDDITAPAWIAMCAGLTPIAQGRLANWLAHGMRLTKEANGVRMERRDYAARDICIFLTNDGEQITRPLESASQDKQP